MCSDGDVVNLSISFHYITAMEKALLYIDSRELPPSWKKEDLLGSDDEDEGDNEEVCK